MNKRKLGTEKEALAEAYLKGKGVRIVTRNYRTRQGEIDLIGREGQTLLFIEVKYRKDGRAGDAVSAVTFGKQRQICRVSLFYLNQKRLGTDIPIRYDVVAIDGDEIRWIRNAFSYID